MTAVCGVSRRRFLGVAAHVLSACAPACRAANTRVDLDAVRIRMMTYPDNHQRIAEPLGRALLQTLPGVQLELRPLTADRLRVLHAGEADIAFAYADQPYLAYVGNNEVASSPFDNLRGIALLQPVPIYLLVRAGLRADSVRDVRGMRVNVGPAGGSMFSLAHRIFDAYGLQNAVHEQYLQTGAAAEQLVTRQLDAMFASVTAPASFSSALRDGATLIPLDGAEIDTVRRQFPFVRRVPNTFGPVTHGGHTSTLGLDSLIVCRNELADHLVYGFTKAFFIALPELAAMEPSLSDVDVEQAAATTIPLHAGALLYYREQELSR